jgi:hypothetical protein
MTPTQSLNSHATSRLPHPHLLSCLNNCMSACRCTVSHNPKLDLSNDNAIIHLQHELII